jgi:flagellar biosynthesis protein FlgN
MTAERHAAALAAFCEELAAEYFEVAGFVELLTDEQRAIQAGDLQRLDPMQSEKHVRIAALKQHARNRAIALRDLGYPNGAPGIVALSTDAPALREKVARTWQTLQAKAWEAKHLAALNAHLCATHLQHFQSRLAALASAAAEPRDVYGGDGSLRPTSSGRAIAQA